MVLRDRTANRGEDAPKGPMRLDRSAAAGPVAMNKDLTAPAKVVACDSTAEARACGTSGNLVVVEEDEGKRCEGKRVLQRLSFVG